jgi:adenosine deaminase
MPFHWEDVSVLVLLSALRIPRLSLCVLLLVSSASFGQSKFTPEQRTARYMDSVRSQPPLLLAFLRRMPKGGDLHNHLSGAIYAE